MGDESDWVGDYLDPVSWVVLGLIVLVYVARVLRHRGGGEMEEVFAVRGATGGKR